MSNITPLSILERAQSSSNQAKAKPKSLEDKVEKRKSSRISADGQRAFQSDKTLTSELRSFANTGETFKSIATLEASNTKPTSKTTIPPSLPPSSQSLIKKQPGKFVSRTFKPINDDEADGDVSEPGTESDLESLIADETISTDPNPDEADESHSSLREQLRRIEIRKRGHDEVDEKVVRAEEARARVEALKQVWGLKVVKAEDDDEELPSKRIKSESVSKRTKSESV